WCVSTIAAQLLQTCHEDYTFRRGFWVSAQVPSPSVLHRNEYYAEEPQYAVKIDTIPRHPWGQEMDAPLKTYVFPSCHAEFDSPEEDWRYFGDVTSIGEGNQGSLEEISDAVSARRIIEELKNNDAKVLMCNGFLSRHTFPEHLPRVKRAIKEFSKLAHDNGMLLMDHIDCTLLWNMDAGFRVLTEDMPMLQMTLDTHLPARGYCIGNPHFIERFLNKVEEYVVDCQLDGIMIDELCYHDIMFCGCEHCRRLFFEETGWRLPLDETSEHLYNRDSVLWRKWNAWRQKRVGDIWFELKKRMKHHNKRFVGMGYTTHTGLTTTYGTLDHGVALEQLARGWDFIGTEIMPRNIFAVYRGTAAFRRLKNYFHHSMGLPVFGEVYTSGDNWNVLYFGWALNSLNGQSSWGINASASVRKEGDADFRRFTEKEGRMNLRLARTQSRVATYFSPLCRDWPQFCSYVNGVLGGIQMMNDMHLEVDALTNVNFNAEKLAKYNVLLFENTLCLSDEEIAVALDFAKAGGTLVLTHRTGMKDGNCVVRKEWPFKKLFNGLEPIMGKNRTYSMVELDGKNYGCEVPVLGLSVRKPKGTLAVRGTARINEQAQPEALLYETEYGKGRIIYTPFVFGHSVWNDEQMVGTVFKGERRPVCEALFQSVICIYAGNANAWEPGNTPAGVLTGVFDVAGKSVIHFLNATGSKLQKGEVVPPNPPAEMFPQLQEDIRFAVYMDKASQAYAVSPDFIGRRSLQFENKDGRVHVVLPKELLKAYTIVYVE
ncbi:MAG: beta-galactosidase trimerization domain-containing protein, partial [Victivallales bacterium]|nr:beta-galactosidase trimerization domain-containing protein [Victivallales bacterium]